MAVKSFGTLTTTSLQALQIPSTYAGVALTPADIATLANTVLNDRVPAQKLTDMKVPGAFTGYNELVIPNRGNLRLYPGDWVATDISGAMILLPSHAVPGTITATGNTHTSTLVDGLSTNVLLLGWRSGQAIQSSNADIPALARIASIASNGLSLTLTAAATGTNAGGTLTAGSWNHT